MTPLRHPSDTSPDPKPPLDAPKGSTAPLADAPEVVLCEPLGEGRTSRVWRGRLESPFDGMGAGTEVAIKILRPELLHEPDARETLSFEREVSRSVHHPALARARYHSPKGPTPPLEYDGPDPAADANAPRPWLLLDLIPGSSLDEYIAAETAIPEPLVRAMGVRLAKALAAMHAAGWVHGDVKPENVRLDEEGRAVLVDLGFARRAGSATAPLGTPGYVAPERARGGPPSASSDVFALGCLLYEAATGAPAAEATGGYESLANGRLRPASDLVPRVSPLLDSLLQDLLGTAPRSRPTAREVSSILDEGEGSQWWRNRIAYGADARRDTVAWSGAHGLPLVGRDDEMRALDDAWRATKSGGVAVLLTGRRGTGKSRLVAEFVHQLRQSTSPPLYLYGRCNAIGDERPGAPLIALLRRWLHLPSGTQPGSRVRALLDDTVPAEVARTLLSALRPGSDEEVRAEITEAAALAAWVLALPERGPTILFLDDVQFAGTATLSALQRVARELKSSRLLLILGLRSQAEIQRIQGLSELRARLSDVTRRVDLPPIDADSVLALVEHLFHHSVPRLRLARTLHERTGGVPGRIGELLRLCNQRGWTRPAPAPGRGLELLIAPEDLPRPESVRVAVAERLKDLSARSRIWLERVAVLGSRIDPDILQGAWPKARAAVRDASLAELVREGWLVASGANYRFAHPVEREETLELASERRLVHSHRAVAHALGAAEDTRDRRPTYRRAFHLREGHQNRALLEMLPELLRRMRDSGHPHRRATLATWGLEALGDLPMGGRSHPLRRVLLEALADAADRLGSREQQRAALEELGEIDFDLEAEPEAGARVYLLHGRHALSSGRFGLARGFLRNAQGLAERAVQRLEEGTLELTPVAAAEVLSDRAEIERLFARIDSERGEYVDAKAYADRALEHAPDPVARAEAHLLHSELEVHEGRLRSALQRLANARRELRAESRGLRERSVRAAMNLLSGRAWRLVGRPARAARAFERAWDLALQSGMGSIEVEVGARRGRLYADIRREHTAELMLRDALFTARRIEDRRGEALSALFLGILLAEQDLEGSADLVSRARRLAHDLGLLRVEALSLAIQARLARIHQNGETALLLATDAWSLVERHGAELPDRIVIGGTLALIHAEQERPVEAQEIERRLRRRMESDNTSLPLGVMRRRHARWTVSLLESTLSPDGPLYPRVSLPESVS